MKFNYLLILFFIFLGCSSSQKVTDDSRCPKIYENNFTEILNEKYKAIYNNDTITYNEIRFECVNSAFYTHKVMYDKFGKWNKAIYPGNRKLPILMWENIDLFSNGKEYIILTNGVEEWKHIYASVMVFDKDQTDIFSGTSEEKEAVTGFFADLIRNNETENRDFLEVYWELIDPVNEE